MSFKALFLVCLPLAAITCAQSGSSNSMSPGAPSALVTSAAPPAASGMSGVARPQRAHFLWVLNTGETKFAAPGTLTTFGGRCSVPSFAVIAGNMQGEATHGGRFEGTTSHCEQPGTGAGVVAVYRDGIFHVTSANGDILSGTFTDGVISTIDGKLLFDESLTFTGGTGRFADASGTATNHGEISGALDAVLGGAPVSFEQIGTISY